MSISRRKNERKCDFYQAVVNRNLFSYFRACACVLVYKESVELCCCGVLWCKCNVCVCVLSWTCSHKQEKCFSFISHYVSKCWAQPLGNNSQNFILNTFTCFGWVNGVVYLISLESSVVLLHSSILSFISYWTSHSFTYCIYTNLFFSLNCLTNNWPQMCLP